MCSSDLASAVSSSSAAGRIGTAEEFSQTQVGQQIRPSEFCAGPGGILHEHLSAEIVCDAQAFQWTQAGDALTPVVILTPSNGCPVTGDELANTACDHPVIVASGVSVSAKGAFD